MVFFLMDHPVYLNYFQNVLKILQIIFQNLFLDKPCILIKKNDREDHSLIINLES